MTNTLMSPLKSSLHYVHDSITVYLGLRTFTGPITFTITYKALERLNKFSAVSNNLDIYFINQSSPLGYGRKYYNTSLYLHKKEIQVFSLSKILYLIA